MLTGRLSGGASVRRGRAADPSLVGSSKPPIIRSSVVLPQPDGPSREKNSPRRLERHAVHRPDLAESLLQVEELDPWGAS